MRYAASFLLFALLINLGNLVAQTELEFLSQTTYPEDVILNDIWGYADETNNREYALVGTTVGLSIVDVTTPTSPEKLHFIDGPTSTWRDMKTYGHYAYTVTEAEAGLLVTDLSLLPESVNFAYTTLNDELNTAHNIFIDEFGYAYVAGFNNVGDSLASSQKGVLILDLNADPVEPPIVGRYLLKYFHDVYARDNKMYSSNINEGTFSIFDVSDKENIVLEASRTTPNEFTHNAWLSDNSDFIFTTDERADGSVASYDISDLTDIKEEHLYKSSLGTRKIPHNAHVLNDWVIVSYYTDGIRILDANNPEILVETAYYDTSPLDNAGFGGCWGAYPFLPSGNILATDRQEGLFVLGPDYQRAAYLKGNVSDAENGAALAFVNVQIESTNSKVQSTNFGQYKTGATFEGDSDLFDITFERYGYFTQTIQGVTLTKEQVLELDVALVPKPLITPQITFVDATTGEEINSVYGLLSRPSDIAPFSFYEDETYASNGAAVFEMAPSEETFELIARFWGYRSIATTVEFLSDEPVLIALEAGYYDDFFYEDDPDLLTSPWTTETYGEAGESGDWEYGTYTPGQGLFWPRADTEEDIGLGCYTTGLNQGSSTNGIINDTTTLVSPPMDLSTYENPLLLFDAYVFTTTPSNVPDLGSLIVEISDGITTTFLGSFPDTSTQSFDKWHFNEIAIKDFVTPSDNMQVRFTLMAESEEYFYLDASIDRFEIVEGSTSSVPGSLKNEFAIYPNPSSEGFNLDLHEIEGEVSVAVYDMQSRLLHRRDTSDPLYSFGDDLLPGVYFVRLSQNENLIGTAKLIKTR